MRFGAQRREPLAPLACITSPSAQACTFFTEGGAPNISPRDRLRRRRAPKALLFSFAEGGLSCKHALACTKGAIKRKQ